MDMTRLSTLTKTTFDAEISACAVECSPEAENPCVGHCMSRTYGYTEPCGMCFGELTSCVVENCVGAPGGSGSGSGFGVDAVPGNCDVDPNGSACTNCILQKCDVPFKACTGLPNVEDVEIDSELEAPMTACNAMDMTRLSTLTKTTFDAEISDCALECENAQNPCVGTCMSRTYGYSEPCGMCFGELTSCVVESCLGASGNCDVDPNGSACTNCIQEKCDVPFKTCTGLPDVAEIDSVDEITAPDVENAEIDSGRRLAIEGSYELHENTFPEWGVCNRYTYVTSCANYHDCKDQGSASCDEDPECVAFHVATETLEWAVGAYGLWAVGNDVDRCGSVDDLRSILRSDENWDFYVKTGCTLTGQTAERFGSTMSPGITGHYCTTMSPGISGHGPSFGTLTPSSGGGCCTVSCSWSGKLTETGPGCNKTAPKACDVNADIVNRCGFSRMWLFGATVPSGWSCNWTEPRHINPNGGGSIRCDDGNLSMIA